MESIFNYFEGILVEAPEFQLLSAGKNQVRLHRHEFVDSFTQYSGEPKPEVKDYQIPTPQLAITVVSAEKGKSGGMTHRLNGLGFQRWDELPEELRKNKLYSEVDGYACCMHSIDDEGNWIPDPEKGTHLGRLVSEKRTQSCKNIMMQFASAIDAQPGADFLAEIERAEAEGTVFEVNVVVEDYEGKDQYRISSFKKAAAPVEAGSLLEE